MTNAEPPLDTFVPTHRTELTAHFREGPNNRIGFPIVGYFVMYAPDAEGRRPTPKVEPALLASTGQVMRVNDFTRTSDRNVTLIGVYPDPD